MLELLTETEIEHDGKRFVVRSAPRPAARLAIVILDKTILRAVADTGTLWLLATIRSFSASVQPRRESVEITSSCDTDELGVFGSHRI